MEEARLFPRGYRGCIFGLVAALLAMGMTFATVNYQRQVDPACEGRLSAGFPMAFVCDAAGESPTSSWGQIDWADADSIHVLGSCVDIVFYFALCWIMWLILRRISHAALRKQAR
jgi:hypothetical protein